MVAPVTVFTEREVDSKLRQSMGDSRIQMRELYTTCHNTPSKSLFQTPKKEVHCSKTNAGTIRQDCRLQSPTARPPAPSPRSSQQPACLWSTRIFAFSFLSLFCFPFSLLKVNKNSPCLFKEKAYAPGHNSGKSYLAHWCAECSRFPQLELELSAGSKLF